MDENNNIVNEFSRADMADEISKKLDENGVDVEESTQNTRTENEPVIDNENSNNEKETLTLDKKESEENVEQTTDRPRAIREHLAKEWEEMNPNLKKEVMSAFDYKDNIIKSREKETHEVKAMYSDLFPYVKKIAKETGLENRQIVKNLSDWIVGFESNPDETFIQGLQGGAYKLEAPELFIRRLVQYYQLDPEELFYGDRTQRQLEIERDRYRIQQKANERYMDYTRSIQDSPEEIAQEQQNRDIANAIESFRAKNPDLTDEKFNDTLFQKKMEIAILEEIQKDNMADYETILDRAYMTLKGVNQNTIQRPEIRKPVSSVKPSGVNGSIEESPSSFYGDKATERQKTKDYVLRKLGQS